MTPARRGGARVRAARFGEFDGHQHRRRGTVPASSLGLRSPAVSASSEQGAAVQVDLEAGGRSHPFPDRGEVLDRLGGQRHHGLTSDAVAVQMAVGPQVVAGGSAGQALVHDDTGCDEPFQGPVDRGPVGRTGLLGVAHAADDLVRAQMFWGTGQHGEHATSCRRDPLARCAEAGDGLIDQQVGVLVVGGVWLHSRPIIHSG